jgi:hypothetical protein
MGKLRTTALASLLAAGLLLAAGQAAAGMPSNMVVGVKDHFPGTGGMACTHMSLRGERRSTVCYDSFNTLGGFNNGFWVKDEARDGYSAVASWSIPAADGRPNPASGYCRNKSGDGTWRWCTVAIGGEGRIGFGAGVYDGNGKDKWPARFQGWEWEGL